MAAKKGSQTDEITGYAGEHIVLLAQTLGLNSYWVELTYRNTKDTYTLQPDEEVKAVIALGYGQTQGVAHPQKKDIEHYITADAETLAHYRRTAWLVQAWYECSLTCAYCCQPTEVLFHTPSR